MNEYIDMEDNELEVSIPVNDLPKFPPDQLLLTSNHIVCANINSRTGTVKTAREIYRFFRERRGS